jgi:hypothetical protein
MNGLDRAKVCKSIFDFNAYLSGFGKSGKLINHTVGYPAAPDLVRLIFTALIFNCPYLQVGGKLNAHHSLGFSQITSHIWLKPNKKGSFKQRHYPRLPSIAINLIFFLSSISLSFWVKTQQYLYSFKSVR